MNKSLTAANQARLEKALSKLYRFDPIVLSLGQWIEAGGITRKSKHVRRTASKKRGLEYKTLLEEKTEYTLWKGDYGLDVPKLVYDSVEAPESITSEQYSE